jgi:hypothetical protein
MNRREDGDSSEQLSAMKAAKRGHMSMGKEFYSTIVRRRPVLVDTIFHQ